MPIVFIFCIQFLISMEMLTSMIGGFLYRINRECSSSLGYQYGPFNTTDLLLLQKLMSILLNIRAQNKLIYHLFG